MDVMGWVGFLLTVGAVLLFAAVVINVLQLTGWPAVIVGGIVGAGLGIAFRALFHWLKDG